MLQAIGSPPVAMQWFCLHSIHLWFQSHSVAPNSHPRHRLNWIPLRIQMSLRKAPKVCEQCVFQRTNQLGATGPWASGPSNSNSHAKQCQHYWLDIDRLGQNCSMAHQHHASAHDQSESAMSLEPHQGLQAIFLSPAPPLVLELRT